MERERERKRDGEERERVYGESEWREEGETHKHNARNNFHLLTT